MRVGASTLGYLNQRSFPAAFESIARTGFKLVDVSPAPPHLYLAGVGIYERLEVKRLMARLGLEAASVNPIEINLISVLPGYADLSRDYLARCLEFAHELEAPYVAFSPGRLFAIAPAPVEDATAALVRQLELLVPEAERLGVLLCVETVPFGIMMTGAEIAAVVDHIGSPWVRATYDVANTLNSEHFPDGVRALGDRLAVAHLSGSWKERWAHTSIRGCDIDYAGYRQVLDEIGFTGPTIYELVDGEDPEERMKADLELLLEWGWEV